MKLERIAINGVMSELQEIQKTKLVQYMEIWFTLAVFGSLSYAISTSIDKYMMDQKYKVMETSIFQCFFDAIILLVIGFLFFTLNFSLNLIISSLILGIVSAFAWIFYFKTLSKNASQVTPFHQSLEVMLIFIASLIIFNENANIANYLGIVLTLIGIYLVLSETSFKIPKDDKLFLLVILLAISNVVYWLLVKKLVADVAPINLAIATYFSTALILFIYQIGTNKLQYQRKEIPKIFIASVFGALGTLFIFSAVSLGSASKVYPMAGLQSVFVFLIAGLFLKEKFYWHRLIGVILVFLGIFLISL